MTDKIRFSIVGFGNIGRRHAEHIMHNPSTELVAICDINPAAKEKVPAGISFYDDISQMLERAGSDVLCVCTPNYLHESHTTEGLNAGRHTVVEKPMAMSIAECDRMIEAAAIAGKTIFAVKQNRYNPPV